MSYILLAYASNLTQHLAFSTAGGALLIFVILMSEKYNPDKIPILVGLYITSAYWFTSSTSFANPAVTVARTLTDTFSGINYGDTFPFIFCQFVGGLLALFLFKIISSNKI